MENLVNIGTIVGTHHLRGSVKITSIFENIELIENERVLLEKNDKKKLLVVKNVKRLNDKKAILDFEGIENITVVNNKDEYHELLSVIEQKIDERRKNGNSNHVVTLVVYNLTELVEIMDNETIAILANVLEKGQKGGYASIVISTPRLSRLVDKASIVVKSYKLALVGIRLNDQTIINVNNKPNMREPQLDEQLHYYVQNKMARKIKVLMK